MGSIRVANHGGFLYQFDNGFKILITAPDVHDLLPFIHPLGHKTPFYNRKS